MICPDCGTRNRSFDVRCRKCNYPLIDDSTRPMSHSSSGQPYGDDRYYDTPIDVEPRSSRRQSNYDDDIDSRPIRRQASFDEAPQQERPAPRQMRTRGTYDRPMRRFDAQDTPSKQRVKKEKEQAPLPERGARLTRRERELFSGGAANGERSNRGLGRSQSTKKFVVILLLIALIASGAVFAANKIMKGDIFPAFNFGTKTNATKDEDAPTIEEVQADGKQVHVITFKGEDGHFVFIPELKRNYKIIGGIAKVTIEDSFWIDDNYNQSSVEATLTPVLYMDGNKRKELPPVVYQIQVPASPLAILHPSEEENGSQVMWYSSMYPIKIQVEKGSEVTIAGNVVSDLMNDEGVISYNAEITPTGDNVIVIYVKTPYYRATTHQLIITRPKMEINLELDFTVAQTSDSKRTTISGIAEPGAVITTDPSIGDSITADENGKFSFQMSLGRYGANTIKIIASMDGKEDSIIEHTVQYMPTVDVYSSNSWKMDTEELYNDLVQYASSAYIGRQIKCTGVITDIIQDEPQMFYFNIGTEESPRIIVIQMDSGKTVKTGTKYDIYADVEGKYEGYPLLNGRYRFVKDGE